MPGTCCRRPSDGSKRFNDAQPASGGSSGDGVAFQQNGIAAALDSASSFLPYPGFRADSPFR